MNKYEREFLIELLKTMDSLKDDENRNCFCVDFDSNYEKLKRELQDE